MTEGYSEDLALLLIMEENVHGEVACASVWGEGIPLKDT